MKWWRQLTQGQAFTSHCAASLPRVIERLETNRLKRLRLAKDKNSDFSISPVSKDQYEFQMSLAFRRAILDVTGRLIGTANGYTTLNYLIKVPTGIWIWVGYFVVIAILTFWAGQQFFSLVVSLFIIAFIFQYLYTLRRANKILEELLQC